MHAIDIIDYCEHLIYRPGWKFVAVNTGMGPVVVTVSHTVPDTSYPPDYKRDLPYPFTFDVLIEPDEVQGELDCGRIVLEAIIQHEREMLVHEAREFFREGPSYIAPFHPHRFDGREAWTWTDRFQMKGNETLPNL